MYYLFHSPTRQIVRVTETIIDGPVTIYGQSKSGGVVKEQPIYYCPFIDIIIIIMRILIFKDNLHIIY